MIDLIGEQVITPPYSLINGENAMTIKWNGRVVEGFDPQPHLEKVLVKYHMYIDKKVSHHALINQVGEIWDLIEEQVCP